MGLVVLRVVMFAVVTFLVGFLLLKGGLDPKMRWLAIGALVLVALRLWITAQRYRHEGRRREPAPEEE